MSQYYTQTPINCISFKSLLCSLRHDIEIFQLKCGTRTLFCIVETKITVVSTCVTIKIVPRCLRLFSVKIQRHYLLRGLINNCG